MDLKPENGGCWFCHQDEEDDELEFSWEFDTYAHKACIVKALEDNPEHPEAIIMADELGIS